MFMLGYTFYISYVLGKGRRDFGKRRIRTRVERINCWFTRFALYALRHFRWNVTGGFYQKSKGT